MAARVLVLREGSCEPLCSWSIDDEALAARSAAWQACAQKLLVTRRADQGRAEVYIFLPGDLRRRTDARMLQGVVERALAMSLDADVYLVLNSREPLPYDPTTHFDSWFEWFDGAAASGVRDLLEVLVEDPLEIDPVLLRAARSRSREREALILCLAASPAWRAATPGGFLATFLTPFAYSGAGSGHQVVVVVTQSRDRHLARRLERLGQAARIVAIVGEPPGQSLFDLCAKRKLALMRFGGHFELRFFLHRLNSRQPSRSSRSHREAPC